MKSLLLCSVVTALGACCFTSCAPKETATTSASSYESGSKNAVETQRSPMVRDTGPRQGTDDTGPRQDN